MKIGMILDNKFPPDPRVENEAKTLIKEGHDVYLFAFSYSKNFVEREAIDGIKVIRYFCSPAIYKFSALAYTLPIYHLYFKKKILNFIVDNDIDVVHIHDLQIARSIFYIKNKIRAKIVLDLHENRPEIMKFYNHVNSILGRLTIYPKIWKRYEKKYIKAVDKVIVVTESAASYYVKEFNVSVDKFVVVPNTVRREFYYDYNVDNKIILRFKNQFNFLYLGETGRRRGTFELIEAMRVLKSKNIPAYLIIVGTSKDENHLKKKVLDYGIENHVFIEGWQNFELFQSYLSVSSVGLCPLHRNIHHDTTYANKIFQYASFGLPIIASDSTAQKKVLKEMKCGLFHKEKNVDELVKRMIEIYNSPDLRDKLSLNAKIAIQSKFNWDKVSKSLIKLYAEI